MPTIVFPERVKRPRVQFLSLHNYPKVKVGVGGNKDILLAEGGNVEKKVGNPGLSPVLNCIFVDAGGDEKSARKLAKELRIEMKRAKTDMESEAQDYCKTWID